MEPYTKQRKIPRSAILVLALVLSCLLLFSATSFAKEETGDESTVTFGVISDIHLGPTGQDTRFNKVLDWYTTQGVDALATVGDITNDGNQAQYNTLRSSLDTHLGSGVRLIASMGNHEANSASMFTAATNQKPNDHYVISGYHFITLSPGSGTFNPETGYGTTHGGGDYAYVADWAKQQIELAVKDDPNKPVFVFYHHPLKDTYYVTSEWYGTGLGDSASSIFSEYPQVVAFSGHIHSPNNNPLSIWQDGGFTAINTATLYYFELEPGMVYGSVPPDSRNAMQGMIVTVADNTVTVKNYDFFSDQWIEQTWTFTTASKLENANLPYTTAKRQPNAVRPQFAADAQIAVSGISENSATVTFDQAFVPANTVGDIVHSYRYDFVNKATGRIEVSFKTWSEYYFLPMPAKMSCEATGLRRGTEYEARIYAYDAFGLIGTDHLTATFTTTGEKEDEGPDQPATFSELRRGPRLADMLDVDFSGGTISDHSGYNRTFANNTTGSNIAFNNGLGKYAATFTNEFSESFQTAWSDADHNKMLGSVTLETVCKTEPSFLRYMDPLTYGGGTLGIEIIRGTDDKHAAVAFLLNLQQGGYVSPSVISNALEYGKWYHIVATYDKGTAKAYVYINGELRLTMPTNGAAVSKPIDGMGWFVIGGCSTSNNGTDSPFNGEISVSRVYSDALPAVEIKMLAARELDSNDLEKPIIKHSFTPAETLLIGTDYEIPMTETADNSGVIPTLNVAVTAEVFGMEIPLYTDAFKSGVMSAFTIPWDQVKSAHEMFGINQFKITFSAKDKAGNEAVNMYTVTLTSGEPVYENTLILTTDAHMVKSGDYFRVKAAFEKEVHSNLAVLNYFYDTSKFEYRGYTAAEGSSVIDTRMTDDGVVIFLMIPDYKSGDYGEVLFSAREDVNFKNEEHQIGLRLDYVVKNDDNEKEALSATAGTGFNTVDPLQPGIFTLIDLSNLIDVFGMDSTHDDWHQYRFFDYNNNRIIDVQDIAYLASLIII